MPDYISSRYNSVLCNSLSHFCANWPSLHSRFSRPSNRLIAALTAASSSPPACSPKLLNYQTVPPVKPNHVAFLQPLHGP